MSSGFIVTEPQLATRPSSRVSISPCSWMTTSLGPMPKPPSADALHLALASFYRMDFLLTWNCRHIANANKTKHLEVLNRGMGLPVPQLITPHQLQPWEASDEV